MFKYIYFFFYLSFNTWILFRMSKRFYAQILSRFFFYKSLLRLIKNIKSLR